MSLRLVQGDFLSHDATYLVHQTNCHTHYALGLARDVFTKFPWANVYAKRPSHVSVPGTIEILGDGKTQRWVVNLNGQNSPGPIKQIGGMETPALRLRWFQQGLNELATVLKPGDSVAFPERIGCKMAKGDWPSYLEKIKAFAQICETKQVTVYLISPPQQQKREERKNKSCSLNFGKHQGKPITDLSIPTEYLEWMIKTNENDSKAFSEYISHCRHEILRRAAKGSQDIRGFFQKEKTREQRQP